MRRWRAPATSASRSISICPSARSCSKATAPSTASSAPERLEAHRLIEEFMILANVAAAETLEKARVPLIYRVHDEPALEKRACAARIPRHARHPLRQGRRACAPKPSTACSPGEGPRRRAAGQRSGAAQPGAGRIRRRELRPFRPQPAPLRPFHLADPPLCRPDRASRADPRAQARRRRPARERRSRSSSPKSPPRFPPPSAAPWWPSARPTTG